MFHVYWPALATLSLVVIMVIMIILMYGDQICARVKTRIYKNGAQVPVRRTSVPRPAAQRQHAGHPGPDEQYLEMERPPQVQQPQQQQQQPPPQRLPYTYSHEIEV